MKWTESLKRKKTVIEKKWFNTLAASYSPDTGRFLSGRQDPFANPVGGAFREGLGVIIDQAAGDMDMDALKKALDPIIRIRAVQHFTPSGAVAFIVHLKQIIREELSGEREDGQPTSDSLEMDGRIDRLLLLAFDTYMECREKLFDIRTEQTHAKVLRTFQRAGLITEIPEE